MSFLALFHEGFYALVGLQEVSQRFTKVSVVVLSQSR